MGAFTPVIGQTIAITMQKNGSCNSSCLKNRRCELTLSLATLSIHDFILFQFESEMKCFHNLFKNNLKWKKACFRCIRDQLVAIVGVIRKDTLLICRIIPHGKKFNLTFTLIIFFHEWISQWRQFVEWHTSFPVLKVCSIYWIWWIYLGLWDILKYR